MVYVFFYYYHCYYYYYDFEKSRVGLKFHFISHRENQIYGIQMYSKIFDLTCFGYPRISYPGMYLNQRTSVRAAISQPDTSCNRQVSDPGPRAGRKVWTKDTRHKCLPHRYRVIVLLINTQDKHVVGLTSSSSKRVANRLLRN